MNGVPVTRLSGLLVVPCLHCSHSLPHWMKGTGSAAGTGSALVPGPACCWHVHPSCSKAEAFGKEKWPSKKTKHYREFRGQGLKHSS